MKQRKSQHNNSVAIRLTSVSKRYTIRCPGGYRLVSRHHEKPTLVEKMVKGREENFLALDNVSLTIKKGERVGIIGPNGSGKTTLFKIIAGITTPTRGNIKMRKNIIQTAFSLNFITERELCAL